MHPAQDHDLIRDYAATGSEGAFRALVDRHGRMVHSVALRHVKQPALADDVTQAVFIVLARKAGSLQHVRSLGGWLLRVTRDASLDALRQQATRARHERSAAQHRRIRDDGVSPRHVDAGAAALAIDAALLRLSAADRDAVTLRYYENASFREIAVALGITQEAARKRCARALVKMKRLLQRRRNAAAVIPLVGLRHATRAALAVPADASQRIARLVTGSAGLSGFSVTLARGVLNMFTQQSLKLKAAITAAAAAVVLCGTAGWWFAADHAAHRGPVEIAANARQAEPVAASAAVSKADFHEQLPAPRASVAGPDVMLAQVPLPPGAVPYSIAMLPPDAAPSYPAEAKPAPVADVVFFVGQVPDSKDVAPPGSLPLVMELPADAKLPGDGKADVIFFRTPVEEGAADMQGFFVNRDTLP